MRNEALSLLVHLCLPNRCPFCEKAIPFRALLCPDCAQSLPLMDAGRCLACGRRDCACDPEANGFDRLLAPFSYEDGPRRAVIGLKFHQNLLNAERLAHWMAAAFLRSGEQADLILPVPMTRKDVRNRGLDQCAALAQALSRELGIPFEKGLLVKVRQTGKQHDLSAEERMRNLESAFAVRVPERLAGKRVILLDDVCTTGSTLRECGRLLKRMGAVRVVALTAARTPLQGKAIP